MSRITCVVCGMQINEKNYNFNEEAFMKSNDKENVIYCPFCGAPMEYLIENGEEIKYDRKKLDENALKIIDHAVKLEVFNGDFYKIASSMAKNEEVKKMFKALSNIEYMHAKIHKKIGNLKEMPVLRKMDYSKCKSDEELLAAACQREKHAVGYYRKYEKEIHEESISKIFTVLSVVEEEHVVLTSQD
ncbi:metal-iron-binding protein [Clostridium sp. P21]|uniref:Metal-iron-binding protein n=1 Tax=Clostridium muellerianum TaxID=2716538 RepID=A0A7Y0HP83_9CLOT|nr:ferritin family protein [Clostridium muellerianum]NMM62776.1 metal-iron-binding protein [Clostridium muellerianum]